MTGSNVAMILASLAGTRRNAAPDQSDGIDIDDKKGRHTEHPQRRKQGPITSLYL